MAVFITVLLVILFGGIATLKYQGVRAMTPEHVEVRELSLDRVIEIGSRSASLIGSRTSPGSTAGRFASSAPVRRRGNGAEWDVSSGAGVMSFRVEPLPAATGFRVTGAATKQPLAVHYTRSRGTHGTSVAIWNALCRALGIPKSPGRLIAQRRRVFHALTRADSGSR